MIIFKNSIFHILTLYLVVFIIILWEMGEIDAHKVEKRGLMDNINNGLRFAGQMFGINNAADVANLVAKAFAPKQDSYDQPDSLNTGETKNSQTYEQHPNQQIKEEPSPMNSGFMIGNMLKLMGLDSAKLGAVALNVIIVIAQMIGSAFIPNPVQKNFEPEADFPDYQAEKPDQTNYEDNRQWRKLKDGSAFDWIVQNPSKELAEILNRIRDANLPDYIINLINDMEHTSGDGDCIKILICKSQPFFWSMQKQVIDRIDGNNTEENDENNENKIDFFYKHLPNLDQFKVHGATCEKKYPSCSFYERTR